MDQIAETPVTDPRDWERWPCLCPDSYRQNRVRIDDCPRCTLGPNLETALQRDHDQETAALRAQVAQLAEENRQLMVVCEAIGAKARSGEIPRWWEDGAQRQ